MINFYHNITVNHGVRLGSEQTFLDSYEKQNELYNEIKKKRPSDRHSGVHLSAAKNVNSALTQSKKLIYLYQYLGKIVSNSNRMLDLSITS
jgi:hypothetical protein